MWEAFLQKNHRFIKPTHWYLTITTTLSTLTDPMGKTKIFNTEVIVAVALAVSLVGVVLLIMRIGSRPKNKFSSFTIATL